MQTKGIGLISTREFVKSKFGEDYSNWINSLPASSKALYTGMISASQWYPFKEGFVVPMHSIADRYFNSNIQLAANQLGFFSAEYALKGMYKVFLLVASPAYLLKRASNIFSTYYSPSEIAMVDSSPKHTTLRVTKFDDITASFEFRLGAWCQRAVELTNNKNIKYTILSSKAKGQRFTEIKVEWS